MFSKIWKSYTLSIIFSIFLTKKSNCLQVIAHFQDGNLNKHMTILTM